MVYVNNKKFACESCIKGHRSSACHHTDRPLFEIKKKGRPVSQCTNCRELRQLKKVHNKCTCNEAEEAAKRAETSRLLVGTSKQKRYIPIVPALPNGLQDVLRSSRIPSTLPADSRQRVDTLLNPCNCKSVWGCKCRTQDNSPSQAPIRGLNALASAAAAEIQASESTASTSAPPSCCSSTSTTLPDAPRKSSKRVPSRPASPGNGASRKRAKPTKKLPPPRGPELPPILFDEPTTPNLPIPTFDTMPPMSMITSLAGSGCTCGLRCACPGCVEHRGPEHASKEHRNCADGCGTCVDHSMGPGLPGLDDHNSSNSSGSTINRLATTNFLDRFFACAASLPAPPPNRRVGLDPMDVTVYPEVVARGSDADAGLMFGLVVNLPKLECCGGRCGCKGATCGCGKTCDGCCDGDTGDTGDVEEVRGTVGVEKELVVVPVEPLVRSCCAGKVDA